MKKKMKKLKTAAARQSARKSSVAKKATKSTGAGDKVALKATVLKGKPYRAALQYVAWSSVDIETLNPLLGRHFVVGQNIMLSRVLLKKGCVVPEHSHHNEQVSYVIEGAVKFGIDGKEIVVREGEVLLIPPNMPHSAVALADSVSLDIFDPPRADWINKTDAYLR